MGISTTFMGIDCVLVFASTTQQ